MDPLYVVIIQIQVVFLSIQDIVINVMCALYRETTTVILRLIVLAKTVFLSSWYVNLMIISI